MAEYVTTMHYIEKYLKPGMRILEIGVTKKGGIVFVAYCMGDATILSCGFIRGEIYNIIEKCMLDPETFDTFSN